MQAGRPASRYPSVVSPCDDTPRLARLIGALALTVAVGLAAYGIAALRLAGERRALVERRLAAAADVLTAPALEVLAGGASRESFKMRLRDLGTVSGLRITLIATDGEALADSELPGTLPNLGDRPEIRAAITQGSASAERLSALTGRDTLYVARVVLHDGRPVGTIRAATDARAADEMLAGAEFLVALVAVAALGLGYVARARFTTREATDAEPSRTGGAPHPLRRVA